MAKTAKQNRGKTLRRVKKGIAKASKRFVKNVKQLSMRGRNIFGRAKKMKIWGGKYKGKTVVLLIIDPQNDFADSPETLDKLKSNEGLPVVGAVKDFTNIITMLNGDMGKIIDEIHISLDSHNDTHIGHVGFWKRSDEVDVEPNVVFKVVQNANGTKKIVDKHKYEAAVKTIEEYQAQNEHLQEGAIKSEEMEAAVETIKNIEDYQAKKPKLQKWAIKYIEKMAENGKPDPLIWNKHCIKGSEGWKVYQLLWKAIITWRDNGGGTRKLYVHEKGGNDLCEMYSIMQAEVTYENLLNDNDFNEEEKTEIISTFDPEDKKKIESIDGGDLVNPPLPPFKAVTGDELNVNPIPNLVTNFNQPLYNALCGTPDNQKILLICGEAKSHCVKSSATDIVEKMETTGHNPDHVYILNDAMSSVQLPKDPTRNALFAGFSDEFIQNMSEKKANITTTEDVFKNYFK